ncbi:MAG: YqjF family protein [Solirubrobacteraceae bacterium]
MAGRWIMRQTWEDLLFAHWPVPVEALAPAVPTALPIDVREGTAWIGVTPFEVTGLRGRWMPPIPGLSRFAEVNVRTYVTYDGKPGIYFLSLDAASRAAVAAARRGYRLPYFHAAIRIERDGGDVRFESRRRGGPSAEVGMRYMPGEPAGDELGRWLTERYCLYTFDERRRVRRADIRHAPWRLRAAELTLDRNTMAAPYGLELEGSPPLVHYAARQDVMFWPLGVG